MLVRAWDYRQRDHTRGVWARLRRLLADADRAFEISSDDAECLHAEGYAADAVGQELQPPKRIIVVPETRVTALGSARELPVSLGAQMLAARCIVLVPFGGSNGDGAVERSRQAAR